MGVILFILLCGCVPFGGDTDEEIFNSIKHGTLEFFSPYWDNISEPAKDLISHMLDRNTEERYSMEQCFNHAWVQSFNKPGDIAPLMLSGGLDNLRHYRTSRKLEKAVVTFISSQLTTMDETYELKKVFIGMDQNGDGQLSREELYNGYKALDMEMEDIDKMIQEIDVDGSGFVDYTEFIAATINKQKILSKDKLEMAFAAFDLDGSGKIGIDELKQLLERDKKLADDSEWMKVILEADQDNDGEIDLVEFKDLMLKLI